MMSSSICAVTFLLAGASLANASYANGNPVQKVVELLDDCKAKINRDLAADAKAIEEYASFCDDEASEKSHALEVADRQIADLRASIEDSQASVANLEEEIKELGSVSAAKNNELLDATALRASKRDEFFSAERETIASIDELSGAVELMKKQTAFAQIRGGSKAAVAKKVETEKEVLSKIINAQSLDVGGRRALKAFLQSAQKAAISEDDDLSLKQSLSQTAAAAQSEDGGILATMESMQGKAEDNLSGLRRREMDAAHSFNLLKASLEDEISHTMTKTSTAQSDKATAEESSAKSEGVLASAVKGRAEDAEYLSNFKMECQHTASKWEERQRSAVGELGAIAKAKEILVGGVKVGFVQTSIQTKGLAHISSRDIDDDTSDAKRQDLVAKLQHLSKSHGSFALSQLANRAASDPFGKIRGLIEGMIEKLMKKALEDATHEAFCQEEMGKSVTSKDEKTAKLDTYQTRMDQARSSINQLTQEISELEGEIKNIDEATAEGTKVRRDEHAAFLQASKDYRNSASAVAKAIEVLKDYYEGASFVQESSGRQPSFRGAQSDSAHGIISVLEMSEKDFTELLAESESTEDQAEQAFKKLSQESRVARAEKDVSVKSKESEVKSLSVSLAHTTEDHSSVSEELDSVSAYLSKLKPQCETKTTSYSERTSAREAEIEGLKDAMSILGK